tara:strand:- start:1816 stop:2304 length:489 start_codon:yes stop_codon:yes gene_type:complete
MGAGILPFTIYKNKYLFLMGREFRTNPNNKDNGLWSDFGGASDKDETYKETAIREGFEETEGFIGNKKDIEKLIKNNTITEITINKYKTYIVYIDYDNNIVSKYRDNFLRVEKNNPELLCKNGSYEKDMIKWMDVKYLKKNKNKFRVWYKPFVYKIIKMFDH